MKRVHENKQILTSSSYNTWYWTFEGALWPEQILRIREICDAEELQDAEVQGQIKDELVRRNKVAWLDNRELYDLLLPFNNTANERSGWNFNITAIEPVQYTVYYGDNNNHYTWHTDTIINDETQNQTEGPLAGTIRKISCTIQLSDPSEYEGGEFEFLSGKSREYLEEGKEFFDIESVKLDESLKDKGTILLFPSFTYHRVKPVTKGIRRSLVCWFRGPKWT